MLNTSLGTESGNSGDFTAVANDFRKITLIGDLIIKGSAL